MQENTLFPNRPISHLVVTWVLLFPLLVFASQYGFSFEHGGLNTDVGASLATQGASGQGLENSVLIRAQLLGVYLTCALLMAPFVRAIGADCRSNMLISGLLLWSIVSLAWSQNPRTTLMSSIFFTSNVFFAVYLLRRFSANDLMKLLLLVGAVAAAASLFLVVVLPQYGLQNRSSFTPGAWEGIFGQKNICGFAMTYLLMPVFFVRIAGRYVKIMRFCYALVLLLIIVMSKSAGAWIVCLSCLGFIVLIKFLCKLRGKESSSVLAVVAIATVASGVLLYKFWYLVLGLVGKDPTLTGRTTAWAALLISIMKQPFLGYGYDAFWQGLHGESANTTLLINWPGMGYAENGVLELWLELGAVGVFLFLLIFIRAVRDAIYCFKREPSPEIMWYCSLLFLVAASNIESGNIILASNLLCILPFVAYMGLRKEAKRVRSQRTT
jgi:exopolysaccharide production protein ExoQ